MTRVKTVGKPKTAKPSYDWRYENSINKKNGHIDISKESVGYSAWRTNGIFSNFVDTIMHSNQMNMYYNISDQMQYDYYYYAVRKNNRFFKKDKKDKDSTDFALVQEFYKYNNERTREALRILSPEQINEIIKKLEKGGVK